MFGEDKSIHAVCQYDITVAGLPVCFKEHNPTSSNSIELDELFFLRNSQGHFGLKLLLKIGLYYDDETKCINCGLNRNDNNIHKLVPINW